MFEKTWLKREKFISNRVIYAYKYSCVYVKSFRVLDVKPVQQRCVFIDILFPIVTSGACTNKEVEFLAFFCVRWNNFSWNESLYPLSFQKLAVLKTRSRNNSIKLEMFETSMEALTK